MSIEGYGLQNRPPGPEGTRGQPLHVVVVPPPTSGLSWFRSALLPLALVASIGANFWMYSQNREYFAAESGPAERYHSGDKYALDKFAVIQVSGTIMPPFSGRVLEAIKQAKTDDRVKGVLLAVDSPGGFVADSHQIYHRLRELSVLKPVVVSMGSLAASGGYYVAMGAGPEAKIFAEPTTWTGSIGVIIPHYEVAGLAEKLGIEASPLKTGEFKDALSPFRPMTDRDREVWNAILDQSFQQFLDVIHDNRTGLERERVQELATGQIYTASDALRNGLIDAIGYEEDALDELKKRAGLTKARVVTYAHPTSIVDLLLGSASAAESNAGWQKLLDAGVPRAMYLASWGIPLPDLSR